MSPAMSTPGSRVMIIGFNIMLVSVSAAMHLGAGGVGLLLCFGGILVGVNLVSASVRNGDVPAPIAPAFLGDARALVALMRHNTAVVGLFMASSAFTAVSGEAGPALCFAMLALLLLGVSLINIGARGE